jgi:hypothetical protein
MYDFETNLFEFVLGYSKEEWRDLNNDLNGGDKYGKEKQSETFNKSRPLHNH